MSIHVCAQHDEYGYRPTKTKKKRNIPLAPVILNELLRLADENNNGYVFLLDGGETPVTWRLMYNKFHKALQAVGMTQKEIKRRGLSIHSWRHFFNTTLQMANVALSKVQSVTGHKSDRMTNGTPTLILRTLRRYGAYRKPCFCRRCRPLKKGLFTGVRR
jgi:integrase